MKPVTTIVFFLLAAISMAHLLRLIFQVDVVTNGMAIPIWLSIFGCIVPAVLAFMLCRENKK
jgi:ABC-type branched-subunit amino acid transport system permease subunit